jgi:hypothetical protein
MVAHLMTQALLYVSLGSKIFFVIIDALQASPQVYITHHLTDTHTLLFGVMYTLSTHLNPPHPTTQSTQF